MKKLGLVVLSGVSFFAGWTYSFTTHEKFAGLEIKPELVSDYLVTYNCDNYEKLEGLHMVDNGDTVTVNYGGYGRRRNGNLICLD